MKIISKYHDYYDSAMGMGYDDHIIYKRTGGDDPISLPIKHPWKACDNPNFLTKIHERINPEYTRWSYGSNTMEKTSRILSEELGRVAKNARWDRYEAFARWPSRYESVIIGFCGRFFVQYEYGYVSELKNKKLQCIQTEDNILIRRIMKADKKFTPVLGEVKDIFTGNPDDIFIELDCPIFTIHYGDFFDAVRLTRNPILKDRGFQRIFDPFTAFQEISMYMGSVLVKDNSHQMESISDPDMASAKGFDKWSFKKLPTKRKNK